MEKEKLTIVKVGGKIVENENSLTQFLKKFQTINTYKLLVHGGGRSATELAKRMNLETKMINGRRITDAAMLEVVTMVYGGLVNKNIVAQLSALNLPALGLTGADMNVILSHKRPVGEIDYGYVGDIDKVDGERLSTLIKSHLIPVLAPLTYDGKGTLLNTNADTIASETAKSLAHFFDVTLIYCFELPGVMRDPNDKQTLIKEINRAKFSSLVTEGIISDGMIPKLENSLKATEAGVTQVIITCPDSLNKNEGTIIK